ncbi:hypothetical protein EYF80_052035 [Liparis tanakae]|uniref:Uncharacterized protein n=1 Tax=Liparis tanakae TaxID=230148 RepID=A0A4Z2FAK2_9TELE|nr:hypothetical protein EYF80_052035 [Liparis tanakae]
MRCTCYTLLASPLCMRRLSLMQSTGPPAPPAIWCRWASDGGAVEITLRRLLLPDGIQTTTTTVLRVNGSAQPLIGSQRRGAEGRGSLSQWAQSCGRGRGLT